MNITLLENKVGNQYKTEMEARITYSRVLLATWKRSPGPKAHL